MMAHFAELDETSTVLRVLVVHNDVTTIDGVEDEQRGIDFLNGIIPDSGTWVQSSYNGNLRYRHANIGDTYDAERDAYIKPQPYPSWKLAPSNYEWKAPVPYPISNPVLGDPFYHWDEDTTSWKELETE